MIEFTELHVERFLTFQQEVTVNLKDRGMVLVRGVNEDDPALDSNDAGKSNLFSAITWALFERLAKTGNAVPGDSVVAKGCKNCSVSLTWFEGKNKFQVIRHRKNVITGDSVTLYSQGQSRAAANEDIVKALGMTYDMFLWSVFWAQSTSIRRLTEFRDSDFKELFDQLIRTEHYEGKRKKVSARLKQIGEEQDRIQSEIKVKEGQIAELDRQIQDEQAQASQFDGVDMKKIQPLIKQMDMVENKLTLAQSSEQKASRAAQDLASDVTTKQTEYGDTVWEYKRVAKGLASKQCSQCKQRLASAQSVDVIKRKLDTLKVRGRALKGQVKELHEQAKEAEETFLLAERKSQHLDKLRSTIKKRLAALIPPGFIPAAKGFHALNSAYLLHKAAQGRLRAYKGRKTDLLTDLSTLKNGLSKQDLRFSRYQILDRAYGPAGLRTLRLVELTPYLNRYATEYSERLVEGALSIEFSTTTKLKGGEVREKYQIDVSRDPEIDFALSGGGMKRRADLIAAFAFDKLRRRLTGKDINLRIYDEPTDGVDAAGEEAVLQLLREECPGTTMFVSHKAFIDSTLFDQEITVHRRDGFSILEEV